MTDREKLIELAERCEKATCDSFDLNHMIARALGIASEPFTASLDAAMTLVDDELVTVVLRGALDRLDECFSPLDNYLTKLRLFVCAAALRTRAHTSKGNQ